MNTRKLTLICVALSVLLLAVSFAGLLFPEPQHEPTDMEMISRTQKATLERADSPYEEVLFHTAYADLAVHTLDLVETDTPYSGDWLYRVNYRYPNGSKTLDGDSRINTTQIVTVLVGRDGLRIGGRYYTTPEGVPFDSVLEWFEGKWNHFLADPR